MKPFAIFAFEAIGTKWQIDIFDDLTKVQQEELLGEIKQRINVFDQNYSRFRPDSLVTQMSVQADNYVLPEDAEILFSTYQKVYHFSGGLVTPLVGKLLVDAGYDPSYSLNPGTLEKAESWDDVMEYDYPNLKLRKPVLLDFGAAGKGYLIDIVGQLLKNRNVSCFCIDAGGDILFQTDQDESLRIGLEDPDNTTKAIGVATVWNQSICGSAGNRRAWKQFHHIMNPLSLSSPKNILATWVVASTAILADVLATCLFFISGEKVAREFDCEYLILYSNRSVEKSEKFPAELFLKT